MRIRNDTKETSCRQRIPLSSRSASHPIAIVRASAHLGKGADLGVPLQNFIEPVGARPSVARPPFSNATYGCNGPVALKRQSTPIAQKAGHALFRPGDPADGCYWVQSGVLVVSVPGRGGSDRIVALAGRGRLVGTLGLVDGKPRSTTARTVTPCQFAYIARATFLEVLRNDPEARDFVMQEQVAMIRQVLERSSIAGLSGARARIASSLLTFVAHLGKEVGEDIVEIAGMVRQADVAAMASVTRESVSRAFGRWRREGILLPDQNGRLRLQRSLVAHEVGADA